MNTKAKLLILLSSLAFSPYVLSGDYQVISGTATSSTSGSKTTIENSLHAILHWDDFSIAEKNHLHFAQVNAASTVLNRVTGNSLSALMGTLTSNGQVYLINPNGVLVGPNALIQTAGFLASTADLSNDQFLAGKELLLSLPGDGKIINQGSIQCKEGSIYLIAKDVSNTGSCSSDFIGIGSGIEVLIQPNSSQRLYIRPDPIHVGEVLNTGTLEALALELRSSSAYEKAIRIEGMGAQLTATIEGGRIILSAENGGVQVDGALRAESGVVHVLGKEIQLGAETHIDTSGPNGGTISIGGGARGRDPNLFNATTVSVEKGARLSADGVTGDGGEIILWSNGITDFNGHIQARALGPSGKGGFAEVSALMGLRVNDHPDLSAYAGRAGTLLLDPGSVVIQNGPNTAPPVSLDVFNDGWINDQLLTTSLIIDTANSTNAAAETMTVNGNVVIAWATSNDLTLIAGQSVSVASGASITSTGTGINAGDLTIQANTGGAATGNFTGININNATISCADGTLTLTGTGGDTGTDNYGVRIQSNSQVQITGTGALNITGTGGPGTDFCKGIFLFNATISSVDGPISLIGTSNATGSFNTGVTLDTNGVITSTTGNISIQGTGGGIVTGNIGVTVVRNSQIISTGTGPTAASISIVGVGSSTGTNGFGALIADPGTLIQAADGTISMTGTAHGTTADNYGLFLLNNAQVSSTGSSPNQIMMCGPAMTPATICIIGQGSTDMGATSTNYGIYLSNSGTAISSVAGPISLQGTGGGDPVQMGISNYGVYLSSNSLVASTGLAAMLTPAPISIIGTGGAGLSFNDGIHMDGGAQVTAQDGTILLNGTGQGTGNDNDGISLLTGAQILSQGPTPNSLTCNMALSTLCLIGQGSTSGTAGNNYGINFSGTNTLIQTGAGNVKLDGTGGGTNDGNIGLQILNSAVIQSTGSGSLTLVGHGSATGSSSNYGIFISSSGTTITSATAPIVIDATAGGSVENNYGLRCASNCLIESSLSAPITITGQGAIGTDQNYGIRLDHSPSITTVDGAVSITGTGGNGSSNANNGIQIDNSATISSSGNGQINLIGIAGLGTDNNQGIAMMDPGSLISSVSAPILLNGTGHGSSASNIGINLSNGAVIQSTGLSPTTNMCGLEMSTICLIGQGSTDTGAISTNYGISLTDIGTAVTSVAGPISLQGTGGGDPMMAMTTNNHGVLLAAGALVQNTASGSISIVGTGGASDGVQINASTVTTLNAPLSIIGTGTGTLTNNRGISILNAGIVSSTGTGTITLNGTGSQNVGATSFNYGILVTDAGSKVTTSASGNIDMTGLGGGTLMDNSGIAIFDAAVVSSTGTGTVTMNGTASTAATSNSHGIYVRGASALVTSVSGAINLTGTGHGSINNGFGINTAVGGSITSTLSAPITLTGTGGADMSAGIGIQVAPSVVSTVNGNILFMGTGGGPTQSHGVLVASGGQVKSTGSGTLTMTGFGAPSGTNSNKGIFVSDAGSLITSATAAILLNGTGQGSSINNSGVEIASSGQVTSTLSAPITIIGAASASGSGNNSGIRMSVGTPTISTVSGNVILTGTTTSAGTNNIGINIDGTALIQSTGSGTITLNGTGSTNGTTGNHGIFVSNASTSITSNTGNISLTGIGHGSGINNRGISIENAASITSNGPASITLAGTGGTTATNSWGILLTGASTLVSSTGGAITLNGTAGSSTAQGVRITSGAQLTSSGSGTLTLATFNTSDLSVDTNAIVITTAAGPITVNSSRDVLITGGSNMNEAARIDCDAVGVLSVTAARDLVITGGSNTNTSAQIQNNAPGDAFFTIGRDLRLIGGSGSGAEASIHPTGPTSSLLFGTIGRDLTLTSGTGLNAIAHIGSFQTIENGRILFGMIDGNVTLTATSTNSFAAIGHGLPGNAVSTLSGYIHFPFIMGDVTLQGANAGAGTQGFAQIGLIDQIAQSSTLTGDITINNLGSITVNGGSAAASARAQIGPGGQSLTTLFGASTNLLTAGVNCSLQGAMGAGDAIITNPAGDLTIVVDNLFPTAPSIGPGAFNFGSTLTATGNLQIYTATQGQNSVPSGSIINGQVYVPGTEFVDTSTEEWNTYYPGGTYGGASFKFYYKNNNIIPPPPPPTPPAPPPSPSPAVIANEGSLADLIAAFLAQQFDQFKCDCKPEKEPNSCLQKRGCYDHKRLEYN